MCIKIYPSIPQRPNLFLLRVYKFLLLAWAAMYENILFRIMGYLQHRHFLFLSPPTPTKYPHQHNILRVYTMALSDNWLVRLTFFLFLYRVVRLPEGRIVYSLWWPTTYFRKIKSCFIIIFWAKNQKLKGFGSCKNMPIIQRRR